MTTLVVVSDARDDDLTNLAGIKLASRYELIGLHAQGALCAVYQARDTVLERLVAVKVAPLADAPAYHEALAAAAGLSYPALLALYDVIEQDDRLYIVQEYVDGRPLSAYLADGAPVRRAVALALQLARACAYAHQHDIAHGDLTPSAILIDRSAVAHLNNLGAPPDWAYFDALVAAVSQSGFGGSAEALTAALHSDARARDVWSVGAALWALVTRPERGSAGEEVGDEARAAPRAFHEDVTPELEQVITRTLDLEHVEPLATADALALALEALDEALTSAVSAQRLTPPLAVRAYRAELQGTAKRPRMGAGALHGGLWREDGQAQYGQPNAPTEPGSAQYAWLDPNQTQPSNDAPLAAQTEAQRALQQPRAVFPERDDALYDERRAWQERQERQNAALLRRPEAARPREPMWPAYQAAYQATGATEVARPAQLMRPWVWTLIGVALFVAFFLLGFLAFPQVRLF